MRKQILKGNILELVFLQQIFGYMDICDVKFAGFVSEKTLFKDCHLECNLKTCFQ